MKIAIPSTEKGALEDDVDLHFGKAATYTIYDSETEEVEVMENTSVHVGGKGFPHELLVKAGVDIVLCSGVGQKIVDLLNKNDIDIFVGADGTVQEAIDSWRSGKLYRAGSVNVNKDRGFGLTQHSL
ncbi:NifB/NifX family molybdenum-iron cluster-binding protein [Methanococcoides sp. FTZ1]|uniref:NifB/NifX family molybdenum-iron cluster-binding protein n=1 Tax=Methanococcoides sp. FTZ1 TaxID=3439061 RepID=UPI003F8679A6